MKRVLVTGGAGFIGRQTLPLLVARGFEVHAVDRRAIAAEGVTWHAVDLLDGRALSDLVRSVAPSHVLHLAWCTAHGEFWTAPENLDWVASGVSLVNAAAQVGVARFVGAGSCAEYDWSAGHCGEQATPLRPGTLYGHAKKAFAELLFARAGAARMSAAWGRVFLTYGPFEHPARLVPYVVRQLLRGERAACTHGEQIRDVLHVHDVARGFVHLLDGAAEGPFNVCSGEPVALKTVVGAVAEALGRPDLLALGALPARPEDPPVLTGSAERLKSTGFAPELPLAAGIAQTVAWWRERQEETPA